MFEWMKRAKYREARPDFRDGRAWNPLDVDDGRPRIVLTVDTETVSEDGSSPVHLDFFNGIRWETCGEIFLIGQRIAAREIQARYGAPNANEGTRHDLAPDIRPVLTRGAPRA